MHDAPACSDGRCELVSILCPSSEQCYAVTLGSKKSTAKQTVSDCRWGRKERDSRGGRSCTRAIPNSSDDCSSKRHDRDEQRERDEEEGQQTPTTSEWGFDGTTTARYRHSDTGSARTYDTIRIQYMAAPTRAVLVQTAPDDLFLLNPCPDPPPTTPRPSALRAVGVHRRDDADALVGAARCGALGAAVPRRRAAKEVVKLACSERGRRRPGRWIAQV